MNYKHILTLFIVICFTTCKYDTPVTVDCSQIVTNPNWTTENFKTEYTIQLPTNYIGPGMVGFEGNTFQKDRTDKKATVIYSFCSPTWCDDFGSNLTNPNLTQISITDQFGKQIILNKNKRFCDNNTVVGIYYYNEDSNSTGKLYWKQNENFKEALTTYYKNDLQNEIEQIIKTIKKK